MREYLHEEVKLPLDWIFMLIGFLNILSNTLRPNRLTNWTCV